MRSRRISFIGFLVIILAILALVWVAYSYRRVPDVGNVATVSESASVDSKKCAEAPNFISNKFADNVGYVSTSSTHYSTLLGDCLVYIAAVTPWVNGKAVLYRADMYLLSRESSVAWYRGWAPDPEDVPTTTACVFKGASTEECGSYDEFSNIINQLLIE